MSSIVRKLMAAGAVVAATLAGVGVGTASATPAPVWAPTGHHVHLVPEGACHGTLDAYFEELPTPGDLRIHITPTGTWGSEPNCPVDASVSILNGIAPGQHTVPVRVTNGPTTVDVHAGMGLSNVQVVSQHPFGMGAGGYVWLDPLRGL